MKQPLEGEPALETKMRLSVRQKKNQRTVIESKREESVERLKSSSKERLESSFKIALKR